MKKIGKAVKEITIYHDSNSESRWPSIFKVGEKELIVFFYNAPKRGWAKGIHTDPETRSLLSRSKDNGRNWSEPKEVFDAQGNLKIKGEVDEEGKNSLLLPAYVKWKEVSREEGKRLEKLGVPVNKCNIPSLGLNYTVGLEGPFIIKSSDKGNTWQKSPKIDTAPFRYGCGYGKFLSLPNKNLLLPFDGAKDKRSGCCFIMISKNDGKSWKYLSTIADDPDGIIRYVEPALALLPSGRIICMMRTEDKSLRKKEKAWDAAYLYESISDDGGLTWTAPKNTNIWGHPAHLLVLPDGTVFCSYGYRRKPLGIRACLSYDKGETWDLKNEIIIRDDGTCSDLGYPSAVQLDNRTILVTYYFRKKSTAFIGGSFIQI